MQRLVFTNANGVSIDLTKEPYGITKWTGFANANLNIQSQQVPFHDGSVFLDALIDNRNLSVTLAINDKNDLEKRYELRRELISILNPKLGEGVLVYTNDFTSKQIKCVPKIPLFDTHNSNTKGTPKASLAWTACDPYWEDTEEITIYLKNSVRTLIENNGDVPCQIKADFISNNMTNPKLESFTQNRKIKLNGTFNSSVVVDTNFGNKKIYSKELDFSVNGFGNGDGGIVHSESLNLFVMGGNEIYVSNDGINWDVCKLFSDINIHSIAYSESLNVFVAIGSENETGVILTSFDGVNWEKQTTNNILREVIFDKNLFVAIGDSETILTSSDGVNWNQISFSQPNLNLDLTKIYYITSLEKFFILSKVNNGVSQNIPIYSSDDGVSWTKNGVYTSLGISNLAYSESLDLFVATDLISASWIYTSSDGINWTLNSGSAHCTPNEMIWNYKLGLFIIVGIAGISPTGAAEIYTSSNGINWTRVFRKENSSLNSIIYSEYQDLLICCSSSIILTSYDGINWEERHSSCGKTIYQFKSQGIFLSSGTLNSKNILYFSYDGINWEEKIGNEVMSLYSIAYSESLNMFAAVGYDNIYISSDGINWEEIEKPITKDLNFIIYSEKLKLFIAVGDNDYHSDYVGSLVVSSDGVNWLDKTNQLPKKSGRANQHLYSITYSKSLDLFIIGGTSTPIGSSITQASVFISHNLIDWESANPTNLIDIVKSIAYSESLKLFVAVGTHGTSTSSDGINWENKVEETLRLNSIAYSELLKLFVAVGNNNILTSSDGINWTKRLEQNTYNFNCIVYSESLGLFAAMSYSSIYLSSDGINWESKIIPKLGTTGYFSICWCEKLNRFVGVGYINHFVSQFKDSENLINKLSIDSDMSLNLSIGDNDFLFSTESGKANAKITYRQKYIGV